MSLDVWFCAFEKRTRKMTLCDQYRLGALTRNPRFFSSFLIQARAILSDSILVPVCDPLYCLVDEVRIAKGYFFPIDTTHTYGGLVC